MSSPKSERIADFVTDFDLARIVLAPEGAVLNFPQELAGFPIQ